MKPWGPKVWGTPWEPMPLFRVPVCPYPTPAWRVGGPGSGFCSMPMAIPLVPGMAPFLGMICPCCVCPLSVPWYGGVCGGVWILRDRWYMGAPRPPAPAVYRGQWHVRILVLNLDIFALMLEVDPCV